MSTTASTSGSPSPSDDWWNYANCLGMDPALFFPDVGEVVSHEAEEACRGCGVKVECLTYAIAHNESGYWGGTKISERRRLRRQLRQQLGVKALPNHHTHNNHR